MYVFLKTNKCFWKAWFLEEESNSNTMHVQHFSFIKSLIETVPFPSVAIMTRLSTGKQTPNELPWSSPRWVICKYVLSYLEGCNQVLPVRWPGSEGDRDTLTPITTHRPTTVYLKTVNISRPVSPCLISIHDAFTQLKEITKQIVSVGREDALVSQLLRTSDVLIWNSNNFQI